MERNPVRGRRAAIGLVGALACAASFPCSVQAAEFWMSGELAVGRSDNIGRTGSSSGESTFASVGLDFTAAHQSSRIDAIAYANLAFQHYDQGWVGSEILGSVTGNMVFTVIPEQITWVLDENFGQARPNYFQAASPENREFINYLSTGPDFHFHVSEQDQFVVGVRGARVDFEESLTSTSRWIVSGAFVHSASASRRWSINAQTQHVDFDFSAIDDFDIDQAYARYEQIGGRTSLVLDVGINGARSPGLSYHGLLARVDLRRRLTERIFLLAAIGTEMTDTAGVLRSAQGALGFSRDTPLPVNSQPYTQTYANLGVQATGLKTQAMLTVSTTKDSFDHAVNGVDRRRAGIEASLERTFGQRFSVNVSVNHVIDDFLEVAADSREDNVRAALVWRLGRMSQLELGGEKFRRSSDLAGGDSEESRVWLSIRVGNPAAGRRSLMGDNVAAVGAGR